MTSKIVSRVYPTRPGRPDPTTGRGTHTSADQHGSGVDTTNRPYHHWTGNPGILAAGGVPPVGGSTTTTIVVVIIAVVVVAVIAAGAGTGRRRSYGRTRRTGRGGGGVLAVLLVGAVIGATVAGGQIVQALVTLLGMAAHWLSGILP